VFPKLVEAIAVPYSGAIREFHKIFVFVVPLLALAYVGFLWYILFAVLELWSGYSIAIWYFGYPPDKSVR
jgi:hypothetical protein